MQQNFEQIIAKFNKLKVLVIGDAMLDAYISGRSDRLCREAPVPIVDVKSAIYQGGGAANTAVNVASLGAQVTFMSVIGLDEEGKTLKNLLKGHKVNCQSLILDQDRKTLTKKRILANNQLLLRYDFGSTDKLKAQTEEYLKKELIGSYAKSDAVIISDYGYGILTDKLRKLINNLQLQTPKILAIDAKYLDLYKNFMADLVKPNFAEAVKLLAINKPADNGKRAEQIIKLKDQILNLTQSKITAITMDREGSVVFERSGLTHRTFAKEVADSQAAGAGDAYTAAFTLSLAAKAATTTSADLSAAASAVAIAKTGTAYCSLLELKDFLLTHTKYVSGKDYLKDLAENLKRAKKRIIFTNGCFDILHSGHVNYLNQAKALGDVLIVGVNSDKSVKRLKGFNRPVNPLEDRMKVLAGLGSVDHIVPFKEDTPINLIKILRPDVYVKGGDYTKDLLPEAPVVESYNGVVRILPFTPNYSTTKIISKISKYYQHGMATS